MENYVSYVAKKRVQKQAKAFFHEALYVCTKRDEGKILYMLQLPGRSEYGTRTKIREKGVSAFSGCTILVNRLSCGEMTDAETLKMIKSWMQ
jgi:hypothetical protein